MPPKVLHAGGELGRGEKRQRTAALQKLAHCPTHRTLAKRRGVRLSSAAFDLRLLPDPIFVCALRSIEPSRHEVQQSADAIHCRPIKLTHHANGEVSILGGSYMDA